MLTPSVYTFLAAARQGSFSAAGQALHLSRVSVMNQINALEAELGVVLFTRTTRGASLTPAGQVFLRCAEQLAALADRARAETRLAGGAAPVIRMGASLMRPCRPFLTWWEASGAPAVTFQLVPFSDETDSLSAMRAALGRTIDGFVTTWSSAPCPEGIAFLPLGSCRCAVALPRNHPLAAKKILSWSNLSGETLLLLREGESPEIDAIRADIRRKRLPVRVLDFDGYYDMSVFNRCARQGWLMELPELWRGVHPSLVTRPVRWSHRLPLGLMHRAAPPRPVQDFLDAVKRENEIRPFRPR